MHHEDHLRRLRAACRLYGGVTAVAKAAGVDQGNLSRWLGGRKTLAQEGIASVMSAIDLPDGQPFTDKVLEWRVGTGLFDLSPALEAYFPNGGKVFFAPWTAGKARFRQLARLVPEVFAISDGKVRAVLRAPTGVYAALDSSVRLLEADKVANILDIEFNDYHWTKGPITMQQFDSAVKESAVPRLQEFWSLLAELGMSLDDVISDLRNRRLKR